VASTPVQRDALPQLQSFSLPELDDGVGALNPLPVILMHMNGHTAERMTPFNHASNKVGMGDRQARNSTQLLSRLAGGIINEADAVPQYVASGCLHKQRPLTDGESWFCTDPRQSLFQRPEHIVMFTG
jgi:hypothetical protein